MKLDDIHEYPPHTSVRARVAAAIKAMGLSDEAAYRIRTDEGGEYYFVVTAAGLCRAEVTRPETLRDDGALEVRLVPWAEVRGASMTSVGSVTGPGGPTVTAQIVEPSFEESVGPNGDQEALAHFMVPVVQRQGRTLP